MYMICVKSCAMRARVNRDAEKNSIDAFEPNNTHNILHGYVKYAAC